MVKENIILVHSFPTNSKILNGFKEYLDDYFNVYFIDMPGFVLEKKPLAKISIENFSEYLDEEIGRLGLKSYFLGGISFGFLVVNGVKVDSKCKGILAMEPYLNSKMLKMNSGSRLKLLALINFINIFFIHRLIWKSSFFKKILSHKFPKRYIDITLKEIDSRTFFIVCGILLRRKKIPKFNHKNYVLLINKNDHTIDSKGIIKAFKNGAKRLKVFNQDSEHYPENITKEYFMGKISKRKIVKIVDALEKNKMV